MANLNQYIEKLKLKDDEAFSIVYNETKNAVYSIIYAIIKNQTNCEDLMQDTYITMLEKLDQFDTKKNFLPWLLTIARNKAVDHYRKYKKELLFDISDNETITPSISPDGERSILVREMLNILSDIEREIFLLSIINNLKRREIAKILEMPLGTVLWHYNNAIKKIKKIKGGNE
jgi:RNA polymerase sigma-70 factor (ECF subfamily)